MKRFDISPAGRALCISAGLLAAAVLPAAAQVNPSPPPAAPLAADGTYRHPVGVEVRLPSGWMAQEIPGATQLVPPDAAADETGPRELYFLIGLGSGGATRADDPRVVQALDARLQQTAPTLQRVGDIEPIAAGSEPGVRLTWEGASPDGPPARAQILAVASKGAIFGLFGIGDQDRVVARETTLAAIFATFQEADGDRDPALAGDWQFVSTESFQSGDFTGASEHRVEFQFQPDGTGLIADSSRFVGDPGDTGDDAKVTHFTWYAARGMLCVVFEDGEYGQFQYALQGEPGSRTLSVANGGPPRVYSEDQ